MDEKIKIETTKEELDLIQRALDFYSRIGIGQFGEIKDHPTFEGRLRRVFALKEGPLEVGDKSKRGEVVEVGDGYIKTKGTWGAGKEEVKTWTDVENVKSSVDYTRLHEVEDSVDSMLVQPRNMLYQDNAYQNLHCSWGIHNENVDDSCRQSFDILQIIRHHFYKKRGDNSPPLDSHVHRTSKERKVNFKFIS